MSKRFTDPFELFDEIMKMVEEEFERIQQEFMQTVQRVDSTPQVIMRKSAINEDNSVEIIEKDDEIRVIVELPGVKKENVKLKVSGNKLIVQAQNDEKKYYKEIELPTDVDEKSAKATYNNGVLQVILKKQTQTVGTEVKIE